MSTALVALTNKLASRLGVEGDSGELIDVLKATAFKSRERDGAPVTDAQLTALMVVANQYGLNPWTKEIYAFPDKQNGIVPIVGVDGWSRIINEHAQFDGIEFRQSEVMVRPSGARCDAPEWIECVIYRKDRTRPTVVREYLDEAYRPPFKKNDYQVDGPWQTHPKRFLRHKSMIQCSRVAFGYVGISDPDEGDRIFEKDMGAAEVVETRTASRTEPTALPAYTDSDLQKNLTTWRTTIEAGRATPDRIIAMISSKYALTEAQKQEICKLAESDEPVQAEAGQVVDAEWTSAYDGAQA